MTAESPFPSQNPLEPSRVAQRPSVEQRQLRRFADYQKRLAVATTVLRVRQEDQQRAILHGSAQAGNLAAFIDQLEEVVTSLEELIQIPPQ